YPGADEPVLTDISFSAAPGQTIGIIGSTGSGKTTLLNLIPRLTDTSAGEVLIDGVPVHQYSREALSQIVSMVPQKAYLFQAPWPPTCDLVHRRPPTTPSGGLLKPHKPKISWPCAKPPRVVGSPPRLPRAVVTYPGDNGNVWPSPEP